MKAKANSYLTWCRSKTLCRILQLIIADADFRRGLLLRKVHRKGLGSRDLPPIRSFLIYSQLRGLEIDQKVFRRCRSSLSQAIEQLSNTRYCVSCGSCCIISLIANHHRQILAGQSLSIWLPPKAAVVTRAPSSLQAFTSSLHCTRLFVLQRVQQTISSSVVMRQRIKSGR